MRRRSRRGRTGRVLRGSARRLPDAARPGRGVAGAESREGPVAVAANAGRVTQHTNDVTGYASFSLMLNKAVAPIIDWGIDELQSPA